MIAGAISHMALAGGWLARKSPPYTVSSKCSQVESPSPLVFTAPLIPPCAHTECERFTGTTEKRSTLWPASAIFIAAAQPASPPPTTQSCIHVAIVVGQAASLSGAQASSLRYINPPSSPPGLIKATAAL